MRSLIDGDTAYWTVIDDESFPDCITGIDSVVDMCSTSDLSESTTFFIQANNEIKNFKEYLTGYECQAISNLLISATDVFESTVENAEIMRDMAIASLKNSEGNTMSDSDYATAVEDRYDYAVDSGCYTEILPVEPTIVMATDEQKDICDLTTQESDLAAAVQAFDREAQALAFNIMMFAMMEPTNDCSANVPL